MERGTRTRLALGRAARRDAEGRGELPLGDAVQQHTIRVASDMARPHFLSTPAGIEEFVHALAEPAA